MSTIDIPDSQSATDCPFKCGVCYTDFSVITDLLDHLKMHMKTKLDDKSDNIPKYCEQVVNVQPATEKQSNSCENNFESSEHLKKQKVQIHDKVKSTQCLQCKKKFRDNQNVKIHVSAVHKKIKNFKCKSCEKTFSQKGNMKTHYETKHLGIRNFKCNLCDETFTQNQYLQNHCRRFHSEIVN